MPNIKLILLILLNCDFLKYQRFEVLIEPDQLAVLFRTYIGNNIDSVNLLENCIIFNEKNWVCPEKNDGIFVQKKSMHNGIISSIFKPVSQEGSKAALFVGTCGKK